MKLYPAVSVVKYLLRLSSVDFSQVSVSFFFYLKTETCWGENVFDTLLKYTTSLEKKMSKSLSKSTRGGLKAVDNRTTTALKGQEQREREKLMVLLSRPAPD